jgi:hypothetical protein
VEDIGELSLHTLGPKLLKIYFATIFEKIKHTYTKNYSAQA